MDKHIEDDYVAETPGELLLLDRIRQLKRMLFHGWNPRESMEPVDPNNEVREMSRLPPTITLPRASHCTVDAETMGLRIRCQSHGPTSFGVGVYISHQELAALSPGMEARFFHHQVKHTMHQTAAAWRRLVQEENSK